MKAKLNSIQTMGLLDGPGVRTVFFLQGCPIRCLYCHNPDTQKISSEKEISIEEILDLAHRYKNYYGKEGGITFSGGEPLLQGEFLSQALKALKEDGFNTCIDTSAFGNRKYFEEVLKYTDTVLLDIKAFGSKEYEYICGAPDNMVKEFMNLLKKFDIMVVIRHVMVPGLTDSKESMDRLLNYVSPIKDKIRRIEILPFHQMGENKYKELNLPYEFADKPAMDRRRARGFEYYVNHVLERQKVNKMSKDYNFSPEQKYEWTKSNDLFKGLEDKEINEIKDLIEFQKMDRGQLIFRAFDSSDKFFLIVSGKLKVYENTLYGKEQILYIYSEGQFIGGHNLIKNVKYIYNGECIEPGIIGVINREVYDEYLVNNPKVLLNLLKMSFRRIRLAEDLIERLTRTSTDEKVASLLLQLILGFGVYKDNKILLDISMTREELASMIGVTRETLSRKLGEYKNLGLIEIDEANQITISNLQGLREIAQQVKEVED